MCSKLNHVLLMLLLFTPSLLTQDEAPIPDNQIMPYRFFEGIADKLDGANAMLTDGVAIMDGSLFHYTKNELLEFTCYNKSLPTHTEVAGDDLFIPFTGTIKNFVLMTVLMR